MIQHIKTSGGALGRARCTTPQFGPLGGPVSRPKRANFEATVRGRKCGSRKDPLQSWIALMIDTSAMQEMELVARSHHVGSPRFYPLSGCARQTQTGPSAEKVGTGYIFSRTWSWVKPTVSGNETPF